MNMDESMDQGPVLTCQKTDCSFNEHDCCYAEGIEVGDEHAMCDTYTHNQVRRTSQIAQVSSCHVSDCVFNNHMDCSAPGITVGEHTGHADCLTVRME
jgi:hypothetical protein